MVAYLLASGIDPEKSIVFLQSQVPEHNELAWILSCLAPMNWLNKMTQYKDKKTKASSLGLFIYPVLMAADILLYRYYILISIQLILNLILVLIESLLERTKNSI